MKPLKISIPKPCHEDWNKMTATEKGRVCSSCQKRVIDFTYYSDRQIVQFFREQEKQPKERVCGNFLPGQLDRMLHADTKPRFRMKVAGIFLGLATAIGFQSKAGSATESSRPKMENHLMQFASQQKILKQLIAEPKGDSTKILSGIVYDLEDYKPLKNARISVEGINKTFHADADGSFSIEIPAELLLGVLSVKVEKDSYNDYSISVSAESLPYQLMAYLAPKGYHEPLRGDISIEE